MRIIVDADDTICIEVIDDGPISDVPHLADAADLAETGRGLMIVQASVSAWGVDKREGKTVVWVELNGKP